MARSIHRQIGDALELALKGIQGDGGVTYNDTPKAVVVCDFFDDGLLQLGLGGIIYAVRGTGEETHAEESSGQGMRALAEFFILCLRPYGYSEDQPIARPPEVQRREYVDGMVQDVITALLEDVHLGLRQGGGESLVENVFSEPASIDRNFGNADLPGWVVVEIRLGIAYTYSGRP